MVRKPSTLKKVTKKFSLVHVGMEPSKPSKQDGPTPQHFHTIPKSCVILAIMPYISCVHSCVHRRVVEGNGLGIGMGVYIVHGEKFVL